MLIADGGGRSTYVRPEPPPPPPPPARTDTAHRADTVATVAHRNNVSPEHLAQANNITPQTALYDGQVLTIPTVEVSRLENDPPKKTPAQLTDEAYAAHQQAVQHRDEALKNAPRNRFEREEILTTENAAVATTKKSLDAAVAAELGDKIAYVNNGVPSQYQTPADSLISAYGNQILQRHANDPAAKSVLTGSIDDFRVQRKANDLIPTFYGDQTPAQKLASINSGLAGQPQAVVDRVMSDPRVQQILKDAKDWIAEPYKDVSGDKAKYDPRPAAEASKRLADITANLPPEYAADIVRDSMPTIEKIANLEAQSGNVDSFTNLSKVVGSLGDSPEANALTSQIAQAYGNQFQRWEGFFGQTIETAVGNGASSKLSLEMAQQLQASGKTDQARGVVLSVGRGAEDLQIKLKQDMDDYVQHTKDLNWLASNAQGKLTPDQLQKAINEYITSQGPEWQSKLRDIEGRITAHGGQLADTIGALKTLPGDLKDVGDLALHGVGEKIGDDKTVQSALTFALTKDPTLFGGLKGESALGFIVEVGHNNKDLVAASGKAYISSQILPAVSTLNASDPASVKAANIALDKLQANGAKFLGVPQSEIDAGVAKLRQTVGTLQSTKNIGEAVDNIHVLDGVKKDLGEVAELRFSTGAAGLAFRTVAMGLTGGNLISQTGKLVDDPSLQNVFGELSYAVGLAQDTAGFGATVKLLDQQGSLGKFGLGTNLAGRAAEKFIGVMNAAYFAAGAVTEANKGNIPAVAFNVTGVTGALLGTFGEAVGLGAWTGPVGAAIVVVATVGVELVKYRTEINRNTDLAEKFLQGADVDGTAAKALSSEALKQASQIQDQLGLTAEQLQVIAAKHPEIFQSPGHAQGAIDAAKACGIKNSDVPGFLDALAQDDPNFGQRLFNAAGDRNDAQPLTSQANMFDTVTQQFPTAAQFVRQHSPDLVGPNADLRRQADRAYESAGDRQAPTIAGLMSGDKDPAFNAELIKIMKDDGTLETFLQEMGGAYHYNGWPEAARDAIQDAASVGVITNEQARSYLEKIG